MPSVMTRSWIGSSLSTFYSSMEITARRRSSAIGGNGPPLSPKEASLLSTMHAFLPMAGLPLSTAQSVLSIVFSAELLLNHGLSSKKSIRWSLSVERSPSRMITLGLNYSQMHDSSACLVRDGELLFAIAEERISRLKHDARFPALAIQACLDFAKLRPDQVDEVGVGWQTPRATYLHDLRLFLTGKWPANYQNVLNSTRQYASMWHQKG